AMLGQDGRIVEVQKIFQVGKAGAITLVGNLKVEVQGSPEDNVDVLTITKDWLQSRPAADIEQANTEINALIKASLTRFFAARDPGTDAGSYKFRVICVGRQNGQAVAKRTKYFMPEKAGGPWRTEQTGDFQEGRVLAFGKWMVQEELMGGKSN